MQFLTPRHLVLALAILAPLGAANSKAIADVAFQDSFAHYEVLPPAPQPAAGAVDMAAVAPMIEHTQPEAGERGSDLGGGIASFYGRKFNGRPTASGERFDMTAMTAAHRTLPFGSKVRVTNPRTGKSVVVRINDRGPFHANRVMDVSRAAAEQLGLIARGHGTVELALLEG